MKITLVRVVWLLMAVLVVGSGIYAFLPVPVLVDTAPVSRGAMEVTVSEEGRTRIREVYQVSAPVAGKLLRSSLEEGDYVELGETVVVTIQPGDPTLLDLRTRQELEATVAAAEAAVALAEAQVLRAQSELRFAQSEFERAETLSENENLTVSQSELERAQMTVEMHAAEVASARANLELKRQELASARARLSGPEVVRTLDETAEQCCVRVYAPVSGQVLEVHTESEQYIAAGTPVMEIGDPRDLEIVVDHL